MTSEAIMMTWRKSSRSSQDGSGGNCVEVAFTGVAVAVRDSKNPDAARLTYPERGWVAFLTTCCRVGPR